MKKVAINVEYNGKSITSDSTEYSDTDFVLVQQLCQEAASGKLTYLKFNGGNNEHYFSKQILMQSVITLIYS